MNVTISLRQGSGNLNHNNKVFITENVDVDRTIENITYCQEDLNIAYNKCFSDAINTYNKNQNRKDRKIDGIQGYMNKLKNSKNGEKLFYECIVQVGNQLDMYNGVESIELREKFKNILDEYMKNFQKRNPNLYVFNAVLHMDETTPHLHINYIPVANNYKKGLSKRNSLSKALEEQGIKGENKRFSNNSITWNEQEKNYLETIINKYNLTREQERGYKREHLSLEQYKTILEYTDKLINNQKLKNKKINKNIKNSFLNKDNLIIKQEDFKEICNLIKQKEINNKINENYIKAIKKDKFSNIISQYNIIKKENEKLKNEIKILNHKLKIKELEVEDIIRLENQEYKGKIGFIKNVVNDEPEVILQTGEIIKLESKDEFQKLEFKNLSMKQKTDVLKIKEKLFNNQKNSTKQKINKNKELKI